MPTSLGCSSQRIREIYPLAFLQVHVSTWALETKQVRFPRTKKRRIRNKWANRPENFISKPAAYKIKNDLYVHPVIYAQVKEQFPEPAQPVNGLI